MPLCPLMQPSLYTALTVYKRQFSRSIILQEPERGNEPMNERHPLIRVGGPVLGAILVVLLLRFAVNQFQMDLESSENAADIASEIATSAEIDTEEPDSAATETS